jgi:hypothetical protein
MIGLFTLVLSCSTPDLKAGLGPDNGTPVAVVVIPDQTSIGVGEVVRVRAQGRTAAGEPVPVGVDWAAAGGAIVAISDSEAQFSAAAPGAYTVRAVETSTPSLQDSTSINVVAITSPVVGLTIAPATASVATGGTRAFSAVATRQDNSTFVPSVSWTATGGTINSSGLYTAGSSAGTFRVVAVLQGGTLADTSTVTVVVPVLQSLSLSPASLSLVTGGSRQFTVTGQWSDGSTTAPAVTYSATGGTITAGGLYTAGNTTGTFRVIAVQQGGSLADTSAITLSLAPPNDMYFNSLEAGCGTDANILLCDDFEDGDWYIKDYDQAMASGGLLQTDGWGGTIYANPITPAGAAVCAGAGFGGSNCAASGGFHNGNADGRNMADHGFAGGVTNLNEAYFRLYFQPRSDYVGGHEKMFDFVRASGTNQMVALCYNYFGTQTIRCIPYLHQDDGLQGQSGAWMGSNMAGTVTLVPTHWYYFEMHVKLNTPGSYDGVFEWWLNDCGVNGAGCSGTPTLRGRYTNVKFRNSGAEASVALGGIWIENWANPGTRGTMYYDNVVAAKAGPIGYAR